MHFWGKLEKGTTGPTLPLKERDLARENAWLRTSEGTTNGQKKKGRVLSTQSTADHQTPTIHAGRSIHHMTKRSRKHFVLGCTSSDAPNFPPIAEASAALRANTALEKIEVRTSAHLSPESG